MAEKTKVLFIGGEGRSGSTILESLLVATPGTCGVGELKNLFERGVAGGEYCGCGDRVATCELWSEVGRRLVGGWETETGQELIEFFTRVNDRSQLPVILSGRGPMVARARSVLSVLYPMIADLTGASVIVDSSKHPAWAYLLAGTDTVDMRVVHLVRHPSGVALSWSIPVVRPQADGGTGDQVMPAHSPVEVAIRWDIFNRLFGRLARRSVPTVLVRYEDYVDNVEDAVRACLELAGLTFDESTLEMGTGHGIAGNPLRLALEHEKIACDDRWVRQLSEATHALVSAITWPVRSSYGYRYDRSAPVAAMAKQVSERPFAPVLS
jgi:hypothetical protein